MDSWLIFQPRFGGAMQGRGGIIQPVNGFRWQAVNDRDAGAYGPEVNESYRQEKLLSNETNRPYRKPTLVDG